jgi:biopolymer transport protein ExbD/biopolymer transport protein TolR
MNRPLEVCLVALALSTSITASIAGTFSDPALKLIRQTGQSVSSSPALQKGISVEMAATRNAVPVPDADRENSLVLAVTQDGQIYLRADRITPAALTPRLRAATSTATEDKVYLKADARTSYAKVLQVLDSAKAAGVRSLVLLVSQSGPSRPGAMVPPKGLKVLVGSRPDYGQHVVVVNVLRSGAQRSRLEIENSQIPWASLQRTLADLLESQRNRVVIVNADGMLPFSDVVNVADICRLTEAEVVLVD